MRYSVDQFLSYLFNLSLQNKISSFCCLLAISLVSNVLTRIFLHESFLMELVVLSAALTCSLVRVNEHFVYCKLLSLLSFNLQDWKQYQKYDYDRDKETISELFKESFILALEELNSQGAKQIRMNTHKWVVNNVLESEKVASMYDVECIKKGDSVFPYNVLALAQKNTPSAYITRTNYKVILTRKNLLINKVI